MVNKNKKWSKAEVKKLGKKLLKAVTG